MALVLFVLYVNKLCKTVFSIYNKTSNILKIRK